MNATLKAPRKPGGKKSGRSGTVFTRIGFGAGIIGVLALVLYLDNRAGSANGFTGIVMFIVVLGLWEFFRMVRKLGYEPHVKWTMACGVALIGEFWMRAYGIHTYELQRLVADPDAWGFVKVVFSPDVQWSLVVLAYAIGLFALTVFHFREQAFENSGMSIFGMFYIPYLFALALHLRSYPAPAQWTASAAEWARSISYGEWLILLTISAARFGDITAFFVGRAFGRRKLIPRVSPAKTVEGALGGLAGSVLVTALIAWLGLPDFRWWQVLIFGLCMGLAGQLGDLMESALKRKAGVKDSGNLVPSFGGMLDLVDNFTVAIPVALFLVLAFHG